MTIAPDTIDATGKTDVTNALNDWVNTAPLPLQLKPRGCYLMDSGGLVLERDGATILDLNESTLWRVATLVGQTKDVVHTLIRSSNGELFNGTIVGNKPPAVGYVVDTEGQHGFGFYQGAAHWHIHDITGGSFRGDHVYFAATSTGTKKAGTRQVVVEADINFDRVYLDNCGRHGITAGGVNGATFNNCGLDNWHRMAIDYEQLTKGQPPATVTLANTTITKWHPAPA